MVSLSETKASFKVASFSMNAINVDICLGGNARWLDSSEKGPSIICRWSNIRRKCVDAVYSLFKLILYFDIDLLTHYLLFNAINYHSTELQGIKISMLMTVNTIY